MLHFSDIQQDGAKPAAAPRNRDLTLAECRALAEAAQPTQPSNALYSRTPEELTDAIFAIAGGRR